MSLSLSRQLATSSNGTKMAVTWAVHNDASVNNETIQMTPSVRDLSRRPIRVTVIEDLSENRESQANSTCLTNDGSDIHVSVS